MRQTSRTTTNLGGGSSGKIKSRRKGGEGFLQRAGSGGGEKGGCIPWGGANLARRNRKPEAEQRKKKGLEETSCKRGKHFLREEAKEEKLHSHPRSDLRRSDVFARKEGVFRGKDTTSRSDRCERGRRVIPAQAACSLPGTKHF